MKQYISYRNENGIIGENFVLLLKKCFEYSTCFSLIFRENEDVATYPEIIQENISKYSKYDNFVIKSGRVEMAYGGTIKYYKCCAETLALIRSISDNLFDFTYWFDILNPEDIYFYREDGTVLLATEIHEGRCFLFPREREDFSDVFEKIKWYTYDYPVDWYNKDFNDCIPLMEKEDFLSK